MNSCSSWAKTNRCWAKTSIGSGRNHPALSSGSRMGGATGTAGQACQCRLTAEETRDYGRRKCGVRKESDDENQKGSRGQKQVEWVEHPFTAISPAYEVHTLKEAQNSALTAFKCLSEATEDLYAKQQKDFLRAWMYCNDWFIIGYDQPEGLGKKYDSGNVDTVIARSQCMNF